MAITVTALATGDTGGAGASSIVLGSCTPSGSAVQFLFVYEQSSTAPTTVSGCGLTFVLIRTSVTNEHSFRCHLYRAHVGSPSTGSVTVDWGSGTHFSTARMIEVAGDKLTGADGADAVVQDSGGTTWYTSAATTGNTQTLAAFADATNNLSLIFAAQRSGSNATVEAGYTALATYVATYFRVEAHYKIGQDTSPSMTWPSHTSDGGAIAVEVADAGGGGASQWGAQMNHTWNRIVQS